MQPRVSELHNSSAKCVSQYGYFEDKNFPIRKTMQDNYIALDSFPKNNQGIFAILDGHGGSQVSQFCASSLPDVFENQLYNSKSNIKLAFQKTFSKLDQQLKLVGATQTGSTICLAYIDSSKYLHIGNLGDTRAVLATSTGAKRVSTDHKASCLIQQQRIKNGGGLILKGRVAGQLAITRALGDLGLKNEGVINVPAFQSYKIDNSMQYLIIASDGLWDVCSDQQAVDLIKNCNNTREMAKTLVNFALKNSTQDNVSVLVIKFK